VVFVDELADRGWNLGPNCHLVADTTEELHAFAAMIGLKRDWFQPGRNDNRPHYDLTASRRRRAVGAGAVEVTGRELFTFLRDTYGD
jgi:hypothetical protein